MLSTALNFDSMNTALAAWQNFYVIIGSAGASLIGLQFVAIALVSNFRRNPTAEALSAFATPTVLHLGGALLVSAVMTAPWLSIFGPSVAVTTCGLAGLGYCAIVGRGVRRQTEYKPVLEDWLWHAILPGLSYALISLAAILLRRIIQPALFAIGAGTLGLLLVGIHNAWDTVVYMVVSRSRNDSTKEK
jgi:hypothetical protein